MQIEPLLTCQDLSLSRGGQTVLREVNLQVNPGDVIGLIGRNGAGKSSLIESLLGFHTLDHGSVRLWDTPVRELQAQHKRRIALVTQRDELMEGLTGNQQITLISSFYDNWDAELTQRLLSTWELPTTRPIRSYSLGQRQRLAIVLALAARPQLLVLDEPVASLDPLARSQFLGEMRELIADPQRAVIISSHIVGDLEAMVNRVWLLDHGRMRWAGAIDDIGELSTTLGDEPVSLEQVFRQVIG